MSENCASIFLFGEQSFLLIIQICDYTSQIIIHFIFQFLDSEPLDICHLKIFLRFRNKFLWLGLWRLGDLRFSHWFIYKVMLRFRFRNRNRLLSSSRLFSLSHYFRSCRLFDSWLSCWILISQFKVNKNSRLLLIILDQIAIILIILNEIKECNPYLLLLIELHSLNKGVTWDAYAAKTRWGNFSSTCACLFRPDLSAGLIQSDLNIRFRLIQFNVKKFALFPKA